MKTTQELKQELKYAQEGLEHIVKAWQDGEYDHDFFKYERDSRSAEQGIAKLENQIAKLELGVK